LYYNKRIKVLSTYEISQLVENDSDDSDLDPNYIEDKLSSSSSDEQEDDMEMLSAEPEDRVYMDPPVERPDGDADKDSGKIIV